MVITKFCSKCGIEFVKPVNYKLKHDETGVNVYCFNCWSKTKNGFKIVSKEKYFYSDKNLEVWK